jgi:hypothetical protein
MTILSEVLVPHHNLPMPALFIKPAHEIVTHHAPTMKYFAFYVWRPLIFYLRAHQC